MKRNIPSQEESKKKYAVTYKDVQDMFCKY